MENERAAIDMSAFKVLYAGERHDIDAEVLLSSVDEITGLVSEINDDMGGDQDLQIRISAPERGSFSFDLQLIADATEMVIDYSDEALKYTGQLVALVVGLFKLRELLGSDDPEEVESENGETRVTAKDGTVLVVDKSVWNIYASDEEVRGRLARNFEALDRDDSIEGFHLKDPDTGDDKFRVPREEFSRLAGKDKEEDRRSRELVEEVTLTLLRVVFDPNRRWQFLLDGEPLSAPVDDMGFWVRVRTGEESFRQGDRLVADLKRKQEFDPKLNDWVTKTRKVVEVKEHIPRDEQGNLFDRDDRE